MGVNPTDPEVARMISIKANKLVGQFGVRRCDVPDIEQELRIRLIESKDQLVAHTASQKTVVDTALRNAIYNIIEGRTAAKRDDRRNIHIDDAPERSLVTNDSDLASLELSIDIREAITSLPEAVVPIARHLLHFTPAETQREFKLCRGKLRQQMKVIADHFVRHGIAPPNSQCDDVSGQ